MPYDMYATPLYQRLVYQNLLWHVIQIINFSIHNSSTPHILYNVWPFKYHTKAIKSTIIVQFGFHKVYPHQTGLFAVRPTKYSFTCPFSPQAIPPLPASSYCPSPEDC